MLEKTKIFNLQKGSFSLVEIILVVALFMLMVVAFAQGLFGTPAILINSEERLSARYYLQEGQEALRSMRDHAFSALESQVGAGDLGLAHPSGYWEFSGASDTFGKFTRTVSLTSPSADIVEATLTVEWTNIKGELLNISSVTRFSNWQVAMASSAWVINTVEQFEAGLLNSVEIGSISLGSIGDWSETSIVERYDISGLGNTYTREIFLIDDLLYVTTELRGSAHELQVFDVSDISRRQMRLVDSAELGTVNDILVEGDYVYIAKEEGPEITILNRSDLTTRATYTYGSSNNASGLALIDSNHLIFSSSQAGLTPQIFTLNISDLDAITVDFSKADLLADMEDVVVHDGYAYFASTDDAAELLVLRLSDNTVVNTLDLSGTTNPLRIFIDEASDQLFLSRKTSADAELYRVDISNPTGALSVAASLNLAVDVRNSFFYQGDLYAATADTAAEVQILDGSTLALKDSIDLLETRPAGGIWVEGSHIYVGSFATNNEVQIVQSGVHEWYFPSVAQSVDLTTGTTKGKSIDVVGNMVYVARERVTGGSEFYIFSDASGSLVQQSSLELNTNGDDIDVSGNFAYLATPLDTAEVQIVSVSNPAVPGIVGVFDHPSTGTVNALSVAYAGGGVLYLGTARDTVTAANAELTVVDVSNRAAPIQLTSFNLNVHVHTLLIQGTTLFVGTDGDTSEIMVFDISTLSAPVQIATFDITGSNNDVADLVYRASDDTLHVSMYGGGGYYAIDASDVTNMSVLGSYGFNGQKTSILLSPDGEVAFLIGVGEFGKQEFNVLDVEDPTDPIYLSNVDLVDDAYGAKFSSDFSKIYVTTRVGTAELKAVAGTAPSVVFPNEGFWMSEAYNTASPTTALASIEWTATEPLGSDVQFMVRAAADSDLDNDCSEEMDTAIWVGSNGSNSSVHSTSPSTITPHAGWTGQQCIQVMAILEGSASVTPQIDEIILNYDL